jgi:hypothetical protein
MSRTAASLLALLALAACEQPASNEPKQGANAEKYARDRQSCQTQVDDYMRQRRNIDDSRRDVFNDNQDRFGRSGLPDTMAAYGDNKSSDRMMERCMAARGWTQPQKSWWEKITG